VPAAQLEAYGQVPIVFQTERVLQIQPLENGLGGLVLNEVPLARPFLIDFDARGEAPATWPRAFVISRWAFFLARRHGRPVGGATVAVRTPELRMLEGRSDLAVLWDIRVDPECRRDGVGTLLWDRAVGWAREEGFRWLKVESQNTNPGACRFYIRQGCVLGAIHRFAYPDYPDEAMLLWYLDLAR